MSKVLVIDTGTTNIKAGVVDEKGRILGFHKKKLTLRKDRKGKAEHSLSQLWESFLEVSRRAAEGYNSSIRLVVITGYQFGFLPIDKKGNPLMGMITLQDTRSRVIMREIRESWDWEKIYLRTGCPPIFLYTLPRIYWLKKFYPEIYKETGWFLGSKDYLLYRIFG
ncbi:carbohydrate kinase, partial [Candidatus Calescamantes bacterium]|nr:carbohydrate kinase [Candidatus Calescamantes bacterium]